MNIHLTRMLKLTQGACLSAAAALLMQGVAWAQIEEAPDEAAERAAGSARESADDASSRGEETGNSSSTEGAEQTGRKPERRETTRRDQGGTSREDERGLDREDARLERAEFNDRRMTRDADRERSVDRDAISERRTYDDADDSFSRRRASDERVRASDRRASADSRRSTQTSFRAEDLRAPDLGLWFNRNTRDGLVIADVAASGAIAQFGFREGDEIVSVSGQRVASERDFLNWLFEADVRYERVPVVVLRDARRRLIYVRPEVFVSQTAFVDPLDRFGVVLDDRYSDRIVVWRVLPRSAAYYAGIRAGDVITAFDGSRVADAGEFVRLIESTDPANVAVEISRNQQARELYVDLAIAEPAREQRTSLRPSVAQPMRMDRTFDDIQSVDPSSDRRLSPRPDVPPGTRVPGGEVGRDRGPISPTGAAGGTPTTPMRLGFPR